MFRKVLIANRGEIAVRVTQTLQEMGITAVAVFSDPDRTALHVLRADEAHALGGTSASETYLDISKLIAAAKHHGCDAVHPGYGFLSENAAFARACGAAGLTFIGPTPEVIAAMGDKIVAKRTVAAAGVPIVPGWLDAGDGDVAALRRAAEEIGYPVLLKAAAGGGGKGMRVVRQAAELAGALDAAAREANSAFGDARIFVEKYIERPRHVEVQIFGDTHGQVVHLFERECSIQRRHQKIIEESPSPALDPALREAMGTAAVRAAQAMGYTNAGTCEFIVAPDGQFYFLEVNTRLQVEHPVTELVTRQDLVRAQVLVAAGERLPFAQGDLRQEGHALEARVYAEDPARGFLPATGHVRRFMPPVGANIRVDAGILPGCEVTVHYDPLLAKLIVWGQERPTAIARMAWALERFVVLGVTTNIAFLRDVVTHPAFRAGALHTHFLEEHGLTGGAVEVPQEALLAAAFALKGALGGRGGADGPAPGAGAKRDGTPFGSAARWRNV